MADKVKIPTASSNYMGPVLFGAAVVFMTFGVAGGWAAIAPLDSAVVAPGVVAVENNRRSVQHLEGGIIAEILVAHGDRVEEGDVLFRLDTTRAQASATVEQQQLTAARVLEARLVAERDDRPEIVFADDILAEKDVPFIAQAIEDQQSQFRERRTSIAGQVGILQARIQQSNTRIDGLQQELTSVRDQIGYINQELEGVRQLYEKGLVSSARLLGLERERVRLEGVIGRTLAEIAGAESTIGEAELQIEQLRQERQEQASEQITEVRRAINELRERLTVSSDVLRRTAITAPRSGQVINLKIFTVGQVIRAGDTLLEIVPQDEGMIINAQVSPLDIDRIYTGMATEVRFAAFGAQDVPVVFGEIREISPDRLVDEDTRMPYFLTRVVIAEDDIPEQLKGKLVPGMSGDIIVPTGERTALQYLIDPLHDALVRAFREE